MLNTKNMYSRAGRMVALARGDKIQGMDQNQRLPTISNFLSSSSNPKRSSPLIHGKEEDDPYQAYEEEFDQTAISVRLKVYVKMLMKSSTQVVKDHE